MIKNVHVKHYANVHVCENLLQNTLFTGSSDCTLKIWKGGECMQTFTGHSGMPKKYLYKWIYVI